MGVFCRLYRLRNEQPKLMVNAFVSIQNQGCSTCGDTIREPVPVAVAAAAAAAAAAATGDVNELKVLTLKKFATSMEERWYCAPNDSGRYTLTKEFQSI